MLAPTSIPVVPLIAERAFTRVDDILALLATQSQYYDGPVEGVYLRVQAGGELQDRAKLVRADFVQGITEHWMSSALVRNQLRF